MSESENSYDTDNEEDTEVEVLDTEDSARDGALQADNEDSEDDQFKKAESSTQKRIDRLTKKCARQNAENKKLLIMLEMFKLKPNI
jgi:hypothetical protein